MIRITNVRLKTKLIVGFSAVASIACVVGAAGWWSLSLLHADLRNVVTNCVPSVQYLAEIETCTEQVKTARRAMLNPNIDLADYRQTIDHLGKAQAAYDAACKKYASLDLASDEQTTWNEFLATSEHWRKSNDKYFEMAGEYRKILAECVSSLEPNPGDYFENCLEMRSQARDALRDLARQAQAWNNLALRGDNPDDYAKYSAALAACDDRISLNLATLKNYAQLAGFKGKAIVETEKSYGALMGKYGAALKGLKVRKAADLAALAKQLHGADLAAVAAFESLSLELDKRTDRVRAIPGMLMRHAMNACIPFERNARDQLQHLIQYNLAKSEAAAARSEKNAARGNMVIVAGTTTGFILALAMGIALSLSINKRLRSAVAMLQDIAQGEGDLSKRLAVSGSDEIGELGRWFNTFVGKLQDIVRKIGEGASMLVNSSTELSATATQLASGAEKTTKQSNSVAAAVEEMSTNMNSVAASTEQMSANVRVVASAVEELTASISEVARSTEQAAGVAGTAAGLASDGNAKISELGTAASEIGKVVEVIQDIAEQTSLLALNATIEAARAGDAGKGFAVVAAEVKELAKQTAAATEDIRRRIEGIQSSTGQAVRSIGEITEVIKKVNEVSRTIASAVEEQSITTREIAKNVAETSTAAATVARGVAESASVTREIAKNIVEVDTAAKQTAQGATIAQTASGKVNDVTEQLHALVGQFKTSA